MTVNPISSIYANNGSDVVVPTRKTTLGSEDFMKLLAVQFQQQDPMKPMEDTAFIAQMAQFSALDQSNSFVRELGILRAEQRQVLAQGYLGRQLTVTDGKGGIVTGEVSGIEHASDGPRVVIGENTYSLSSVLLVEPVVSKTEPVADEPPPAS
ncbi:MAG TPA: flagellar hook capping FlgD N-terminal domain-containing protein [Opitutaceae bacterium]|nr:flagellar hook capping FlgD N-terminal domain-containing protein [Opitutaceae bacterium]